MIARYQPHLIRASALGRRLQLTRNALDQLDVLLETSSQALLFVNRRGLKVADHSLAGLAQAFANGTATDRVPWLSDPSLSLYCACLPPPVSYGKFGSGCAENASRPGAYEYRPDRR